MSDEGVSARFRIGDISPTPDDEALAAIAAALDTAWPQPVAVASTDIDVDARWRFGLRRWNDRSLPRRTWGS